MSTDMQDRKMLLAAILSICALSSKKILIYNEELIVAACFIGFLIFTRKSFGSTFKETLDGRIESIQEELQQFFNPSEVILLESNEQQRNLRISLRICGTVVESLPAARCAPKVRKDSASFVMPKPKCQVSNTSQCRFFPPHPSSGRYSHGLSLLSE
ncbi:hypothetical protein LUZ63_023686 [Rhynchospora breviuscula]|uniref:ATP synthase protein MI25 n=1 Tax=Rhynchospora breviuscula TaxID=2022672 RepID=A0A9Q0BXB9_9POAL|nr:hypothetical protein LUZ63_023686 [Rhynchospora breviuscula]